MKVINPRVSVKGFNNNKLSDSVMKMLINTDYGQPTFKNISAEQGFKAFFGTFYGFFNIFHIVCD